MYVSKKGHYLEPNYLKINDVRLEDELTAACYLLI